MGERRELGWGLGRGGVRVRQQRSHVNTTTNMREEKRTVHCSRKMVLLNEQEKRRHSYIFSQKGEPF